MDCLHVIIYKCMLLLDGLPVEDISPNQLINPDGMQPGLYIVQVNDGTLKLK